MFFLSNKRPTNIALKLVSIQCVVVCRFADWLKIFGKRFNDSTPPQKHAIESQRSHFPTSTLKNNKTILRHGIYCNRVCVRFTDDFCRQTRHIKTPTMILQLIYYRPRFIKHQACKDRRNHAVQQLLGCSTNCYSYASNPLPEVNRRSRSRTGDYRRLI